MIPDNAEWLLIDTTDGWTFQAGATRLVPAPNERESDRLLAEDAVSERIAYALRHGVPLAFPEAAGTRLDELDGDFWLISLDNGDWTEKVLDVVVVAAPDDLEPDNTEDAAADASRYASREGQQPVVQQLPRRLS